MANMQRDPSKPPKTLIYDPYGPNNRPSYFDNDTGNYIDSPGPGYRLEVPGGVPSNNPNNPPQNLVPDVNHELGVRTSQPGFGGAEGKNINTYGPYGTNMSEGYGDSDTLLKPNVDLPQDIYDVYGKQVQTSDQFRDQMPGLMDEYRTRESGRAYGEASRGFRADQEAIRRSASKRGLLYSGLREGAESEAQRGRSEQYMNKRAEINRNMGLVNKMNEYDLNAINAGFNIANMEQDWFDLTVHEIQIAEQERAELLSGALGVAGKVLGDVSGKLFSKWFE